MLEGTPDFSDKRDREDVHDGHGRSGGQRTIEVLLFEIRVRKNITFDNRSIIVAKSIIVDPRRIVVVDDVLNGLA